MAECVKRRSTTSSNVTGRSDAGLRFERDERQALRPLPVRPLPRREQRLRRRVAHDAFVDVDTVRYSVPHRLVWDHVEVVIDAQRVRVFHGTSVRVPHSGGSIQWSNFSSRGLKTLFRRISFSIAHCRASSRSSGGEAIVVSR